MQKLHQAVDYILSEEYLLEVLANFKWCSHGSNIIEYFIDQDFEEEFVFSKERKNIIKKYLKYRVKEVLKELEFESPEFLYRTIYSPKKPEYNGFFGFFWSSDKNTNPCVELRNEREFLLSVKYDESLIDWKETLKSRMDFLYGSKEKEYYLFQKEIKLFDIKEIF